MKKTSLLFVSNGLANRSGFQTQVLTLLAALTKDGQSITLLDFESVADKQPPPTPGVEQVTLQMTGRGPFGWLRAAFDVRKVAAQTGARVIHARGHVAGLVAWLARMLGAPRFVIDMRGVLVQEGVALGKWRAGSVYERLLLLAERYMLRGAGHVLAVSEAMREYVHLAAPRAKVSVVPCCVPEGWFTYSREVRREQRLKLGIERNFVIAYSGGLDTWQQVGPMLDMFAAFRAIHDNAHLLLLSNGDPDAVGQEMARRAVPVGCYTLKSVPHREVPLYLSAADVALLLRDDTIINRVASPVKFAEYLLCGLPVVTTEGIGDISELVQRTGVGICIHHGDHQRAVEFLATLAAMEEPDAERLSGLCVDVAKDNFDLCQYLDTYRSIYRTVGGGK